MTENYSPPTDTYTFKFYLKNGETFEFTYSKMKFSAWFAIWNLGLYGTVSEKDVMSRCFVGKNIKELS